MKRWMFIVTSILILGILGALLGYKFIYNKPHRNYETASVDYAISCEALFAEFINSRAEAENKYNGKVLEINGILSVVENPDSLSIVVFALQEGIFGDEGIRCTLLSNYRDKTKSLQAGDRVTIKGYCTGYNDTDIILEKCSLIQYN